MYKHGMRYSKEYKAWSEAKQRCHNEKNDKYHLYGERGISVCDEWKNDFIAFYNYMGEKPRGYELDRIDNNKGYQPGNVRWCDKKTNIMNRRNTVKIEFKGRIINLDDYAKENNLEYGTAWNRMKNHPHLINGERKQTSGEKNHNCKLTDIQVTEILNSKENTKKLTEIYSVSRSLVQLIRRGEYRTIESSRRYEAKTL